MSSLDYAMMSSLDYAALTKMFHIFAIYYLKMTKWQGCFKHLSGCHSRWWRTLGWRWLWLANVGLILIAYNGVCCTVWGKMLWKCRQHLAGFLLTMNWGQLPWIRFHTAHSKPMLGECSVSVVTLLCMAHLAVKLNNVEAPEYLHRWPPVNITGLVRVLNILKFVYDKDHWKRNSIPIIF